jgi:hypothetical protein
VTQRNEGEEAHENMRLDAIIALRLDRSHPQLILLTATMQVFVFTNLKH